VFLPPGFLARVRKVRFTRENDNFSKSNGYKRCHSFAFFIDPLWSRP
jgi:hypothetical protein